MRLAQSWTTSCKIAHISSAKPMVDLTNDELRFVTAIFAHPGMAAAVGGVASGDEYSDAQWQKELNYAVNRLAELARASDEVESQGYRDVAMEFRILEEMITSNKADRVGKARKRKRKSILQAEVVQSKDGSGELGMLDPASESPHPPNPFGDGVSVSQRLVVGEGAAAAQGPPPSWVDPASPDESMTLAEFHASIFHSQSKIGPTAALLGLWKAQ